MTYSRLVFTLAGVWGIVVLTPLYALFDITGRAYAPPMDYPHFFYGFLSVAMAWQMAFLVIGSDPVRFRPLMIPSVIEKLGWVVTVVVLYSRGDISAADTVAAVPDGVLGVLFVAACVVTPRSTPRDRRGAVSLSRWASHRAPWSSAAA